MSETTAEIVLHHVLLGVGLDRPGAEVGDEDYEMRRVRAAINAAGDELVRRAEWSGLTKRLDRPGPAEVLDLPADFDRLVATGAVRLRKDGGTPVRAVTSLAQWLLLEDRPSRQPFYRLLDGKIAFAPPLDAAGAWIHYVSRQWVEGKSEVTQNGDRLRLPARLVAQGAIWRWKRAVGLAYDDELAEFEAAFTDAVRADQGDPA